MKRVYLGFVLMMSCALLGADSAPAYFNDFEKTPPGNPPEDLMILNGAFSVVKVDGNSCLELTADPLDGDGFLFGPGGRETGTVSARIWASASGRRFPEFGIGANDAGGYKLIAVPAQSVLELRKGEDVKASSPFQWKSGTWTHMKLEVTKGADGKFQIRGKAWADGTSEHGDWNLSASESTPLQAGRASAWAMPYSEQPVRFDDLEVR